MNTLLLLLTFLFINLHAADSSITSEKSEDSQLVTQSTNSSDERDALAAELEAFTDDDEAFITEIEEPPASMLMSADELNAPDPDPGNTAGFSADEAGFIDTPEDIFLPERDDQGYTPLSLEESEAKIAEKTAEQKAKLAAEVHREAIKTAEAKRRKDTFATNLTGLKEAGIDIEQNGFGFTGKFFVWQDAYARLTFALNSSGFFAQGSMPELKVGPLHITGTGPDGIYGTPDDGVIVDIKINKDKQRILVSGMIDLLSCLARCEMAIGNKEFQLFTQLKILDAFETKFLAQSQGLDGTPDFLVMGAAEKDFLKFIEKLGGQAIGQLGNFTSDGLARLRKHVKKAEKKVKDLKQDVSGLIRRIKEKERKYDEQVHAARKALAPLFNLIKYLLKQVEKIKSEIRKMRRKMGGSREKSTRRVRKAIEKVNKMRGEVDKAKRALSRARRRTKWYKPWTYAVVAYQAARLAVVEAARWSAEKVLQGIIELINVMPVDTIPPLPFMWGGYAALQAKLKVTYQEWRAALMLSNPASIKTRAELIAAKLELAGRSTPYYGAKAALLSARVTLLAAEKAAEQATKAAVAGINAGMKAAGTVAGTIDDIIPFRAIGSNYRFSLNELKSGKLPLTSIIAKVFGKRRILSMQIDLTRPDTFITAFPKMLIDLLRGKNGVDISKEIEIARAQFADEFAAIAQSKKKVEIKKEHIKQQESEYKETRAKLEKTADAMLQKIERSDDIKKGEGEYGKKFDVMDSVQNQTRSSEQFDAQQPQRYKAQYRRNHYNWNDQWVLAAPNRSALTFDAFATKNLQIGFEAKSTAKPTDKLFEVVLGFEGDKGIVIRDGKNMVLAQTVDEATLFSGDKDTSTPFWISYHNGYIAIGSGITVGNNLLLDWQLTSPPATVTHYSFSCHEEGIELANIATAPAVEGPFGSRYSSYERFGSFTWHDAFKLTTPDAFTATFKAKTISDLCIGLTNNPKSEYARYLYTVGLDDNTHTSISRVTEDGKKYNRIGMTKDRDALIATASSYDDYWVTYNKGHLLIGKGDNPSENIILDALEEEPITNITHLGFTSWGNSAEFRDIKIQEVVPIKPGTRFSAVNRRFAYHYKDYWQMHGSGSGTLIWRAKGDADMTIGLHTSQPKEETQQHTYQVIFGADSNSKTVIRDAAGTDLATTEDPEALIQEVNNYSYYWLSYQAGTDGLPGTLAIGAGKDSGKNLLLEHTGVTEAISHFAFSNNDGFVQYADIASKEFTAPPRGQRYHTRPHYEWHDEWQLPEAGKGIISFFAHTSYDLRVGLHTRKAGMGEKTYEVVFGARGNTRSEIRDHNSAVLRADNNYRSKIPNDNAFHHYWVAYNKEQSTLSYGMDTPPTSKPILSFKVPVAAAITHFSFSSSHQSELKKIKTISPDDKTLKELKQESKQAIFSSQKAQGAYQWREKWRFKKKNNGLITFDVRTGDTALIALHNNPSARGTTQSYQVAITKEKATLTDARGTIIAQSSDARLTSGGDYHSYWLCYYKGHIVLGQGTLSRDARPEESMLLEASVPSEQVVKDIEYFSFSSKQLLARYRNVKRGTLGRLTRDSCFSAYHQNGTFTFARPWQFAQRDVGALTFEAKAHHDVVVGMSASSPGSARYVAIIGAQKNSKTTINGQEVATAPRGCIQAPGHFLPYWITFNNGTIKIGHGREIGEQTFADWSDDRPDSVMHFFGLSSSTNQVTYRNIKSVPLPSKGFNRRSKFIATAANKQYDFNEQWKLPAMSSTIRFKAQGKSGIRIGLHTDTGVRNSGVYEAIIGARNNKGTVIKANGTAVAEQIGGNGMIMFPDDPDDYWLSYHNGRVTVGRGDDPSMEVISSWKDSTPKPIRYVAFSSGDEQVSFSKIKIGPYVKANITEQHKADKKGGVYKVREQWRHPSTRDNTFMVTASGKEALIGLARRPGDQPIYELVVSATKKSNALLKKNGTVVAQAPYTMPPHMPTTFWLSNTRGVLSAGLGDEPGKKHLLVWQDNEQLATPFLGLSSTNTLATYTDIKYLPGVMIARNTSHMAFAQNGSMTWNDSWLLTPRKTVLLDAQAPHADIRIGLRRGERREPAYTLRIGGWKNSMTALLKDGKKVAEINHSMKLGTKKVWLTYSRDMQRRNRFVLGTGIPGHKVLLDWTDPDGGPELSSFGLSNGTQPVLYSNIQVVDEIAPLSAEERAAGV